MKASGPDNTHEGLSAPPEGWLPLVHVARRARTLLHRFSHIEAASGVLLIVSAAIALLLANSPWSESYARFWHTSVGMAVGTFQFERRVEWIVNDGLMVIFFFVVGMEIRREIHSGELSQWARASLPVLAAFGGMVVPAGLYLALAGAPEIRPGWGVPMATDIAFALGILTLLGKRVPPALRVLLLALAVIDDLGAIVVIALFYSSGMAWSGLAVALGGIILIFIMQRAGVRSRIAYVLPGFVTWAGIYASGIHPTIAGVAIGLMTPTRLWMDPDGTPHESKSPADALIEDLHPWVAFGIMPVFALANAGVSVGGETMDPGSWMVLVGVILGLVVGKPLGIFGACWVALRLRLGVLPVGMTYRHLLILGVVAGVGFTMALFIAQLAFVSSPVLPAAKLGVLVASGVAAVLSLVLGVLLLPPVKADDAARSANEAELYSEK